MYSKDIKIIIFRNAIFHWNVNYEITCVPSLKKLSHYNNKLNEESYIGW